MIMMYDPFPRQDYHQNYWDMMMWFAICSARMNFTKNSEYYAVDYKVVTVYLRTGLGNGSAEMSAVDLYGAYHTVMNSIRITNGSSPVVALLIIIILSLSTVIEVAV